MYKHVLNRLIALWVRVSIHGMRQPAASSTTLAGVVTYGAMLLLIAVAAVAIAHGVQPQISNSLGPVVENTL